VVFLVMAGISSSLAAQLSSASSPHEKPAGCHQHGNKTPERSPADYKCCIAGHDAAIIRSASAPHAVCQIHDVVIAISAQWADVMLGTNAAIPPILLRLQDRSAPLRV
jgi:hypothetical protein